MNTIIFTMGSITYAMKGKKALHKNNIGAKIIKLDPSKNKNGCSYGVEIYQQYLYEAVRIFNEANIDYKIWSN